MNLKIQILFIRSRKIAGTACAAENAAAPSKGPVPVGASHAAVQGQLVKLFSKSLLQIPAERVEGKAAPLEFGGRRLIRSHGGKYPEAVSSYAIVRWISPHEPYED